jgi:small-conductance mechanosensitive channel
MRAVILLLTGVCAVVTAEAQTAVASSSPKNFVEAVADPQKADNQDFDIEYLCRSFAFTIDRLSVQLSQTLGPWSQRDLFLQITPAKIILGILSALVALAILQIFRRLLAVAHRWRHSEPSKRFWVGGILRALRKGLGIFFWVTAVFLFVSPLLPHIAIALQNEGIFHLVSKLTELGYFAALIIFCYNLVLLINSWLTLHAQREPRQWYYPAFPFLGRLLFYNFILISLQLCLFLIQLPGPAQALGTKLVSIASAIVNCVTFIQMIRAVEDILINRTSLHDHDIYKFRGFRTRLQVLRRLLVFLVILISIGVILMNIDGIRQVGTGLLASAGVAGIIFGFAAQKSLSTIIAGLQIALTGPMKIEDVVIVEGEYGTIEEITLTYVVVKLWDLRRMILPITYFLEKPFQNWTRTSSELIGTVFLYTDFTIPIDEIRQAAEKIVAASPLWDKRVYGAQVTDWKNETIEVRILVSSDTAGHLFDLRCEVREKILKYLQERNPQAFPHVRTTFFPADGSSFGDQKPQRLPKEKSGGQTEAVSGNQ